MSNKNLEQAIELAKTLTDKEKLILAESFEWERETCEYDVNNERLEQYVFYTGIVVE